MDTTRKMFATIPQQDADLTGLLRQSLKQVEERKYPNAAKARIAGERLDATDEPMVEFSSGARRSQRSLRYDLIPAEGLRRLAERYTLGAEKYGDNNWQKGLLDPEYVAQFKAHLLAHWVAYLESGCAFDDNLGAMAWGVFALMEAEKAKRIAEGPQCEQHQFLSGFSEAK